MNIYVKICGNVLNVEQLCQFIIMMIPCCLNGLEKRLEHTKIHPKRLQKVNLDEDLAHVVGIMIGKV